MDYFAHGTDIVCNVLHKVMCTESAGFVDWHKQNHMERSSSLSLVSDVGRDLPLLLSL
jgi:hypothetical protein